MLPLRPLDDAALLEATEVLTTRDPDLAVIVARHGPPPLWARPPGFETLARIILEQQVSLRSAEAAIHRLVGAVGSVSPEAIVAAGEAGLRAAGLTRQKARYLHGLAVGVDAGTVDLAAIDRAPDDEARDALLRILGVGPWTADIYLLMALLRPDVWPTGDLALATAMRRAKRLRVTPGHVVQLELAERWRPYRSVGARLLWHAYLAGER